MTVPVKPAEIKDPPEFAAYAARHKDIAKDPKKFLARFPEVLKWLKKNKPKTKKYTVSVITSATNALRAEKQKDALPLGRDLSVVSPDSPRQIIYGTARVGGVITFIHSRASNQYLDLVVSFAGHEINQIEKLFLDDAEVIFGASPDPRWSTSIITADGQVVAADHRVFMAINWGSDSQAAQPDLVSQNPSKWTAAHRQLGVAHTYIILRWDAALFGDGIPDISFQVRGRYVYDPRSSTYVWSSNAALCAADYLMNTRFGLGVPSTRIDMGANDGGLIAAANICDETVGLVGGGTELRYTVNGYFNCDEQHGRVLERMAAAMGGHITYVNGRWKFWPAKWRAPAITLTQEDLRSNIRMQTMAERSQSFNTVRGTFVSAAEGYIEKDYPVVKSAFYIAEDGEEIAENIDYHFVTSAATAQRLSKIELERIRQGIQLQFHASLKAFQLQVPDTVMLTLDRYGWASKTFEVIRSDLILDENGNGGPELVVDLVLRETAEGVFAWNDGQETVVDLSPNTNLPSPFLVTSPQNVTLTSGTNELYIGGDGTVRARVKVMWDDFSDFFVSSGGQIETQYKKSTDSLWTDAAAVPGSSTFLFLSDVEDGVAYDVRVRAVNAFRIPSPWVTITNHFVVGKTAPPSDVTDFAGATNEYGIQLSWSAIPDIDRSLYEIREGGAWDLSALVARANTTYISLPLRSVGVNTFWIKAIDTSGNYSTNAASTTITVTAPTISGATSSFSGPDVIIDWDEAVTGTWAVDSYLLSRGAVFASATQVAQTKSTLYTVRVDWLGAQTFWVQARDVFGNLGTPVSLTVNVLAPNSVQGLGVETIDNNALIDWTEPAASTLPIAYYIVKRGAVYATATSVGNTPGTFAVVFESVAGTYTYWVVAVDTAGNLSTEENVNAFINEPPDFELKADLQLTNGTTLLNCVEQEPGVVIGPVYTSVTWAGHFVANGWSTIQDQISAGYPYFIQPTADYGRWEKIHDLGVTLNNVLLHLAFSERDLIGDVDVTPKIAYSTDNVSYTEEVDVSTLFSPAVRYIRIRLDMGTVP